MSAATGVLAASDAAMKTLDSFTVRIEAHDDQAVTPRFTSRRWDRCLSSTEDSSLVGTVLDRSRGMLRGSLGTIKPTNIRLLRTQEVLGRKTVLIRYQLPLRSLEGPLLETRTEWLDATSLLLLRQESRVDDAYTGQVFFQTTTLADFQPADGSCPSSP